LTERIIFGRLLWQFWLRTGTILAVAAAGAGFVQWLILRKSPIGWVWLIAAVGVSGLVYFGVLWVVGLLDDAERRWLKNLMGRFGSALGVGAQAARLQ
jgi:hypothetical protein